MSKLSAAQRRALTLDDFGDPDNRLFPIVDQNDVDSAARLIGKAKNPEKVKTRIIAIAKRKKLKIPDAWQEGATARATMSAPSQDAATLSAYFDLPQQGRRVEGDYAVYPNSLLWVAGAYPDKRYEMTPEENWAAVEAFKPVWGNIEHSQFLAGKACHVRQLRLDASDPERIRGEVAVPLGLDLLMDDRERKLSCEWHRDTKELTGLALTTNPRIADAALMSLDAQFQAGVGSDSRHDTYDGQKTIQTLHDLAAKGGALCDPANPNGTRSYSSTYFVSSHERTGLQAIHDAATAHGAQCSKLAAGNTFAEIFAALFAGARHSAADAKDIQAIHDLAQKQGADCAPAQMSGQQRHAGGQQKQQGRSRKAMPFNWKFWEKTDASERAALREQGVEVPDEATFSEIEARVAERLAAERAKDREALRTERATRLQQEAAFRADELIRQGKLTPPEREQFIAFRVNAALEDTEKPAQFAGPDGKATSTSRVAAFDAIYEARPTHGLFREYIDPGTGKKVTGSVLMNQTASADGDPNDISTPAGARAGARAWAEQNGNGKKG